MGANHAGDRKRKKDRITLKNEKTREKKQAAKAAGEKKN